MVASLSILANDASLQIDTTDYQELREKWQPLPDCQSMLTRAAAAPTQVAARIMQTLVRLKFEGMSEAS